MKLISFKYTKPKDGSVSDRLLLALSEPGTSNKYAGIDLSDIDPNEAAKFVAAAVERNKQYVEDMKVLQNKFDLKFAYKQFLQEGVSEVVEV